MNDGLPADIEPQVEVARSTRFGNWEELEGLCQSGKTGSGPSSASERPLVSVFAGDQVSQRMGMVRQKIAFIRQNWDQYDRFVSNLRGEFDRLDLSSIKDHTFRRRLENLVQVPRDWAERMDGRSKQPTDYDAIRLYTSYLGYDRVFSLVNRVFRTESGPELERDILNAVFLVELLNIDLYNYCKSASDADRFEGVVYRGMCVTPAQRDRFAGLMDEPISERYISIPLGLVSSSTRQESPRRFMEAELARRPSLVPLLWKIQVVGIRDLLIQAYQQVFSGVISTICAVPVARLSDFRDEEEALLRGPFLQVLRFVRDDDQQEKVAGVPVSTIEVVMLTANRDHYSTMQLGANDVPARDVFGAMAGFERNLYCADFNRRFNNTSDTQQYQVAFEAAKEKLEFLLRQQGLECRL